MRIPMFLLRSVVAAATLLIALAFGNPAQLAAQTDVIRGRVTTTEGLPLANVRVTATSIPGNVTREARTNNQGAFQIAFPSGPGDYIMGYALIGYNYRQFEIKRLADEDVLLADARLGVVQLDTVSVSASSAQRINRNSQTPDVSGTERPIDTSILPPELQGDIAAMAASLPGVTLIPGLDGEPDGFSVLGLGADQNSVTMNGMQSGTNTLPRDASISSSLTTSSYDATRGGFSGGNFNIRPNSGTNIRNRGGSALINARQLEWTDRAAQSLASEYNNISLGGIMSGPISLNKSFYNLSYQLGRQSRDNQTLLTTSALGLQTAGVAFDSVSRLVSILQSRGVPTTIGASHSSRLSDNGSFLGVFDFSPPTSSSGTAYNLTVNGNWSRSSPVGGGATQLAEASGDRTSWGGGIQGRHSGYFGRFLSETQVGINSSKDYGSPYLDLPSGRVRVSSLLDDGASSVQNLGFGGSQSLSSTTRSTNSSIQNTLSFFDDANKHRLKIGTELDFRQNSQNQAANLLGTFTFNSLSDLEAGLPASYSRTLTASRRSTGQMLGGVGITDSYRRTPDLQIQYGVRIDGSRFTTVPTFNSKVESVFGRRNNEIPMPITFSPRAGFSWTVGQAQEVSAFFGAARTPRAVIRGGIAVNTNTPSSGLIASALDNTGLASGTQQISCVGPASPVPDWSAYMTNPFSVPNQCADGTTGTLFSSAVPNVTLIAHDYKPQRSVRSNLSWGGSVLDGRFSLNVEGVYSINLNNQRSVDLNFRPDGGFKLSDESRPVYVQPTSIVSTTGSIASADARVTQDFARVTEIRSDLRSNTAQLSLSLSPIFRTPTRFGWSGSYTYMRIREQYSGFSSTSGNPLSVDWAPSGQGPHSINYNLRYIFFNAVQVSWNGQFRSGSAFTPTVAGDINGDGAFSNDRAFVYSPTTQVDTALSNGMTRLLANSPKATRDCLEKQIGTIAARNSCRAPWSSSASLVVALDRTKFRMPSRANVQFSLSNPLGGADLALHGSNRLKGWGQSAFPDQSLLYVRGFDPSKNRYIYEVNQRFGATRPQLLTQRAPVVLTTTFKIDLGPTRERQTLMQQLASGRSNAGSRAPEALFRIMATGTVLNPMTAILRQMDSLHLTSVQADSLASMNRSYNYRVDSLWAPVARFLAQLPERFESSEAYDRFIEARHKHVDMMSALAPTIRDLLTAEQRRKLPSQVLNYLDPRYLASIRNGTGTYVNGTGFSSIGGLPIGLAASEMMQVFSVIR
jgi:hypothetical protein